MIHYRAQTFLSSRLKSRDPLIFTPGVRLPIRDWIPDSPVGFRTTNVKPVLQIVRTSKDPTANVLKHEI
jgi:hypothetical protein